MNIKEMILEALEGTMNESMELTVTFWTEKDAKEAAYDFKGDATKNTVVFPVRSLRKANELADSFPKHKVKSVNLPD